MYRYNRFFPVIKKLKVFKFTQEIKLGILYTTPNFKVADELKERLKKLQNQRELWTKKNTEHRKKAHDYQWADSFGHYTVLYPSIKKLFTSQTISVLLIQKNASLLMRTPYKIVLNLNWILWAVEQCKPHYFCLFTLYTLNVKNIYIWHAFFSYCTWSGQDHQNGWRSNPFA